MDVIAQDVAPGARRAPVRYPRRSFEALLNLVRPAPPALLEALRQAGFDPEHPEESYPAPIWHEVQELFCRHLCPDLAHGAGMRALGARFVEGFVQTVVGRVVATAAHLVGPERVLARLPGYFRAGVDGPRLTSESVRAGVWCLRMEACTCDPEFFCGVVEAVLRRVRVPNPSVTVLARAAHGFDVLACWTAEQPHGR